MGLCVCDHDGQQHYSRFFEIAKSTRAAGARPCHEEDCDCKDFILKPFFRRAKSTKSQQEIRQQRWKNSYLS